MLVAVFPTIFLTITPNSRWYSYSVVFALSFEITVIVLLKVVLSYRWVVFLGYII